MERKQTESDKEKSIWKENKGKTLWEKLKMEMN